MDIKFTPIIPIIPKFTSFDLGYVAEQALREFGKEIIDEFNSTATTWKNKPVFIIRYDRGRNTIRVFTDNEIYGYVNDGTRPHPIAPVNADVLRMRHANPKTMVGRIKSGAGGKYGDPFFATYVKRHPGIKARHFDDLIYNKMIQKSEFNKIFGRLLTDYMRRFR